MLEFVGRCSISSSFRLVGRPASKMTPGGIAALNRRVGYGRQCAN